MDGLTDCNFGPYRIDTFATYHWLPLHDDFVDNVFLKFV
jgi:hypothetical protein